MHIPHFPVVKTLFFIYLMFVSGRLYANPETWTLINNVNLIFHEAGHFCLMFFGEILYVAGGTIFEIGIPLLIFVYFLVRREYYSAMFGAWWLSTAFYSASIYAADAVVRQLPLLGGDSVGHDWFTLLTRLQALRFHDEIANLFLACSVLTLLGAIHLFIVDVKLINRNGRSI